MEKNGFEMNKSDASLLLAVGRERRDDQVVHSFGVLPAPMVANPRHGGREREREKWA